MANIWTIFSAKKKPQQQTLIFGVNQNSKIRTKCKVPFSHLCLHCQSYYLELITAYKCVLVGESELMCEKKEICEKWCPKNGAHPLAL